MENKFKRYKNMIDAALGSYFTDECAQKDLLDAMRYSLLAGGKRIRGVLVLCFAEMCGLEAEAALPFACAVEMLHTYSLIHDDLPCMDNDDFRRGKPTNHIVYGEAAATLAGDALQAAAFETALSAELPRERVLQAAKMLAAAAGPFGICGGQVLDMAAEGRFLDREEMENIHNLKTSSMIIASAKMGVIAAGGSAEQIAAAEKYARCIGLAFQIRDDMLDMISSDEELGKPIGSDAANDKSTFVSLYGLKRCGEIVDEKTARAVGAVKEGFSDSGFAVWLAEYLSKRKN